MSYGEVIVGIFIFLLLGVFLVIAILGLGASEPVTILPPENQPQTGQFLSPCTTRPCNAGLVCDGVDFVCKYGTGGTCSQATDCTSDLYCSGICVAGPHGELNQFCPCQAGLLCVNPGQSPGPALCKGLGGTACRNNSDCVSTVCNPQGFCTAGAPNAYPCDSDIVCASNNCSQGFCQPPSFITGTLGAACAGDCLSVPGAVCDVGPGMAPLTCVCIDGPGLPGACSLANQGLLDPCSEIRFCATSYRCLNDLSGAPCGAGITGCTCVFPYVNPNVQDSQGQCIPGMGPGLNQQCFNATRLGCDNGGRCVGGSCNGPSVVSRYRFSNPPLPVSGVNFVGALQTAVEVAFPGPPGITNPYKFFATALGVVDTLYLVDRNQGLLSVVYNSDAGTILPWQVEIPATTVTMADGITTTKILLDAGYNGATYIVAFRETQTTSTSSQSNDTLYSGPTLSTLTVFNPRPGPGLPGTQYTTGGAALTVNYVDISPPNNVSAGNDILISSSGTVYLKSATQAAYSQGTVAGGPMNGQAIAGTTGPARFYFDVTQNAGATGPVVCPAASANNPVACPSINNLGFVGAFTTYGGGGTPARSYTQVLQFSGNVAGIAMPLDDYNNNVQYRVFDYDIYSPSQPDQIGLVGMLGAHIIMLAEVYQGATFIDNVVAVSQGGSTTILPYRIGTTPRSAATANGLYILSTGSCG